MGPPEFTKHHSVTESTTSGCGEMGQWPRCERICSATAAGGETSRVRSGKWWERPTAGKQADADTCRSLSCFPRECVIRRWWTSWRLRKSESSRPVDWRDGVGTEPRSGVGSGDSGLITFLFFSVLVCLSSSFHLSAGMKGSGGELRHLAG